jgi:hypothetical protein
VEPSEEDDEEVLDMIDALLPDQAGTGRFMYALSSPDEVRADQVQKPWTRGRRPLGGGCVFHDYRPLSAIGIRLLYTAPSHCECGVSGLTSLSSPSSRSRSKAPSRGGVVSGVYHEVACTRGSEGGG